MFRQLESHNIDKLNIQLDGKSFAVPAGISLAAALLVSGEFAGRTNPVNGEQRSGFCMMGVCFECLVEVNGTKQRSCQVEVAEGMIITTRTEALNAANSNEE